MLRLIRVRRRKVPPVFRPRSGVRELRRLLRRNLSAKAVFLPRKGDRLRQRRRLLRAPALQRGQLHLHGYRGRLQLGRRLLRRPRVP
jgi:hypothetical protein